MTLNELKAKRRSLIREYNNADRQAKKLSQAFTVALNKPDITGAAFREIETASKNAFKVKAKIDSELLKIENEISRMKSKKNPPTSKRSKQGTATYNKTQRDRAIKRAKSSNKPVLLSYWHEGWKGHERRINLYAMPDGTIREIADKTKNPTIIKAKKISHIDISKTHNPAKLSAADLAKIEKARGLIEALGYKRPVDIRAAWQDTLFSAGMRGRKLLAAVQVATKKRGNPKRRRNLDHKDADHPIDVSQHWRSGPPGYMSPWQRAAALGQSELFSTGIQLSKRAQELRGRRSNPEKMTWVVGPYPYNDELKTPLYYGRANGRGYEFSIFPEVDLQRMKFEGYRMKYHIYLGNKHAEYPKRLKSFKAMQAAAQKILNSARVEEKKYFALSDLEKIKLQKNPGVTKSAYRSGLKEAPASQLVKLVRIGLRTGNTAAAITADLKKTGRFSAAQISRAVGQGREAEQKAKQNPARGTRKWFGSREFKATRKTLDDPRRRIGHVELPDNFTYEEGKRAKKSADKAWRRYADKYDEVEQRKNRKANGAASAVKQIFEKFGGRASTKTKTVSMPNGTPAHVAKLGTLRLIKLKNGPRYEFKGAAAPFLAADHRGKLHVVGGRYRANPPGQTLGEIETIEYETTKPHLGQDDETIYFHHLGEETGERPVMRIDSDGLIKIVGGAYTIEADGIHN